MKSLLSRPIVWALATVLCGLIYVAGFTWSPSSYGIALQQIGVLNAGPDIGQPRPIRSDEWAVVTPLTQVAVRNGFERINRSSLYEEDLRINYGIPLADWGLLFKPTLWGFFVFDPAYAYSLHWFAIMAMFLAGHALLFARLGIAPLAAGLLSVTLYFTGFAQFWWNEKGPVLAFFPWVMLTLLSRRLPTAWQLLLFYWLSASWLITNLYPPVQVSLAFVGALLVLGWQPQRGRAAQWLATVALTAVASAATVALYLKDYLVTTAATVYPGSRSAVGGAVPWQEAVSYLFPFSTFDGRYDSVIGNNICEVGTGATALTLLVACFLDYRALSPNWRGADPVQRMRGCLLGSGILLMAAWMLVPLPSWAGYPFLWNHAPGERMEHAFGLLLAVALTLLAQRVGLVWSSRRLLLCVGLVLGGWAALKLPVSKGVFALNDLVLLASLPLLWLWRRARLNGTAALLAVSALAGLLALWGFNPLQSARPIFAQHDTPVLRELTRQQSANEGVLAQGGLFGAVQNGLGFRSVAHVTAMPALGFWRKKFPDMPEQSFMDVFNRYSHIVPAEGNEPRVLHPDRIAVPLSMFNPYHLMLPEDPPHLSQGTGQVPVLLFHESRARGMMVVRRSGLLRSVAPAIGNGQGMSDGRLVVRVCRAHECLEAGRDLRESVDNTYFELVLPSALKVSDGDLLEFSMHLEGATTPTALWVYPAPADSRTLELSVDGRPERWLPRLDLGFERAATP